MNVHDKEPIRSYNGFGSVVDIVWDPLSLQYFLVAFDSGVVCVGDISSESYLHKLTIPASLTSLFFLREEPGNFLAWSRDKNVVHKCNVSKRLASYCRFRWDTIFPFLYVSTFPLVLHV